MCCLRPPGIEHLEAFLDLFWSRFQRNPYSVNSSYDVQGTVATQSIHHVTTVDKRIHRLTNCALSDYGPIGPQESQLHAHW